MSWVVAGPGGCRVPAGIQLPGVPWLSAEGRSLGSKGLTHFLLCRSLLEASGLLSPRKNPVPQHFLVQVGQVRPSNSHSVQVAMVIRHPKYNLAQKAQGGADVALLKLKAPVIQSKLVNWIALPPARLTVPSGMRCWVTGWGNTAVNGKSQDEELK